MSRENLSVCKKCGAKFANKDEATKHFWDFHRATVYGRMALVAMVLVGLAVAWVDPIGLLGLVEKVLGTVLGAATIYLGWGRV